MKHFILFLVFVLLVCWFSGCGSAPAADIAATTLPVYEFTQLLCEGTGITVSRLITENVSCLHDYTLQVAQMRAVQGAKAVVISGAGLEEFLDDVLQEVHCIDASLDLHLIEGHHHDHGDREHSAHAHAEDPHIWLSPENAAKMAENICHELCRLYPQHQSLFEANLEQLHQKLHTLQEYGEETLKAISCREMITFHDGFSYLAESFGLTILAAVEEEAGSEASAEQLISLISLVQEHQLSAVFTEVNGSASAAQIVAAETGCRVFALDMAMSGSSYFDAMYHNIQTLREALQ